MKTKFVAWILVVLTALASPAAAQVASPSAPMINSDVVQLVTRGLSEDVVIGAIRGAGKFAFDLSVDGLTKLKASGVGDRVIIEMQTRNAANALPAPAPAPVTSAPMSASNRASALSAEEWQKSYDKAKSKARSAKTWGVVSALYTVLAVPAYFMGKNRCADPYAFCSPMLGMSQPLFTSLFVGTMGGLGIAMNVVKSSHANNDIRRLEATRPQMSMGFDFGEHQSVRIGAGREFGVRYQLKW